MVIFRSANAYNIKVSFNFSLNIQRYLIKFGNLLF